MLKNNSTCIITRQSTETAKCKSHGHRENKAVGIQVIYWVNMNASIEETVKNFPTGLDFQSTQPKDKTVSDDIPGILGICKG